MTLPPVARILRCMRSKALKHCLTHNNRLHQKQLYLSLPVCARREVTVSEWRSAALLLEAGVLRCDLTQ
jgi:hypothetical protein